MHPRCTPHTTLICCPSSLDGLDGIMLHAGLTYLSQPSQLHTVPTSAHHLASHTSVHIVLTESFLHQQNKNTEDCIVVAIRVHGLTFVEGTCQQRWRDGKLVDHKHKCNAATSSRYAVGMLLCRPY